MSLIFQLRIYERFTTLKTISLYPELYKYSPETWQSTTIKFAEDENNLHDSVNLIKKFLPKLLEKAKDHPGVNNHAPAMADLIEKFVSVSVLAIALYYEAKGRKSSQGDYGLKSFTINMRDAYYYPAKAAYQKISGKCNHRIGQRSR